VIRVSDARPRRGPDAREVLCAAKDVITSRCASCGKAGADDFICNRDAFVYTPRRKPAGAPHLRRTGWFDPTLTTDRTRSGVGVLTRHARGPTGLRLASENTAAVDRHARRTPVRAARRGPYEIRLAIFAGFGRDGARRTAPRGWRVGREKFRAACAASVACVARRARGSRAGGGVTGTTAVAFGGAAGNLPPPGERATRGGGRTIGRAAGAATTRFAPRCGRVERREIDAADTVETTPGTFTNRFSRACPDDPSKSDSRPAVTSRPGRAERLPPAPRRAPTLPPTRGTWPRGPGVGGG
jgi:hypothetical protein